MKCTSKFGGERCVFESGHERYHMSSDGKLAWGVGDEGGDDYPDGLAYDIEVPDESDEELEIVNATQHYVPYSHVVVERRRKKR